MFGDGIGVNELAYDPIMPSKGIGGDLGPVWKKKEKKNRACAFQQSSVYKRIFRRRAVSQEKPMLSRHWDPVRVYNFGELTISTKVIIHQ